MSTMVLQWVPPSAFCWPNTSPHAVLIPIHIWMICTKTGKGPKEMKGEIKVTIKKKENTKNPISNIYDCLFRGSFGPNSAIFDMTDQFFSSTSKNCLSCYSSSAHLYIITCFSQPATLYLTCDFTNISLQSELPNFTLRDICFQTFSFIYILFYSLLVKCVCYGGGACFQDPTS